MFNLMDTNSIGMVTKEQFIDFLKVEHPPINLITHEEMPLKEREEFKVDDSFEWQYEVIKQIK